MILKISYNRVTIWLSVEDRGGNGKTERSFEDISENKCLRKNTENVLLRRKIPGKERVPMKSKKRRKRRRQRTATVILFLLLICVVGAIVFFEKKIMDGDSTKTSAYQENGYIGHHEDEAQQTDQTGNAAEDQGQEQQAAEPTATETPSPEPTKAVQSISSEGLHSAHALLIRAEDGAVMMDKGASEQTYPASITKIMTAILAIENLPDLDEQIAIPEEMFTSLAEQGASVAGFDPYEQVTVRSLLYGVLLPSGADACITLAEKIAGSEEGFVQKMNEKAAELNLTGTHFMNCTGLHDPQHYTTCKDLAELMRYCMKNETFRTIVSTKSYTTEPTSSHPSGITMYDSMFTKFDNAQISTTMENGFVVEGGKTGFTDEAGQCLASFGTLNGSEYILVTTGAPAQYASEIMSVQDAQTVYSRIS